MLRAKLRYNAIFFWLLFFLITLFNTHNLFAANVTLSWTPPTTNADATPLTDLAGYKIYFGTSSGNYSQSADAGNVTSYTWGNLAAGTPYYFTITAYDASRNESSFSNEVSKTIASVTYYCDKDTDSYINAIADGTCAGTGCEPSGCQTAIGNDCNDNNANINPAESDINCNGIDDNCNGQIDEGYVAATTTCGTGACTSTGQLTCQSGSVVNTCSPGTPAANDNTCDGLDDNCNGQIDEGYVAATTTCGTGACASTGIQQCTNGQLIDSCTAYIPTTEICDGLDNNCDSQIDEGCTPVIVVSKILLTEDFANGIPNSWLVNGKWNTSNSCGKNIDDPMISPYAIVDSSCATTGIDELVTPSFDTNSCNAAQLAFSNHYHHNSGNVEVNVSNDAGATWTNSLYLTADDGYPAANWKDIDINNIAGAKEAKIKFRYSNNTGDGYWALDNIWVTCQPDQLEFSSQDQGPSQVQTIMITNAGSESLSISTVGIGGTASSDFIIDNGSDTCSNRTLLALETCTLDVVFLPSSAETKSANLYIPSNDPASPLLTVPLTGTVSMTINPRPIIKANGSTEPITVRKGRNVTVTIELDPGSYEYENADWWVLREYNNYWQNYSAATRKWSRGTSLYKQAPLVSTEPVKVLSTSKLSTGSYKFYFGVDTNMNGVRDPEEYYYDEVTVNVK